MEIKPNSHRAAILLELVISLVIFSIVILSVFCVIVSNAQFLQIFRQEAALKEDNAHIVDKLKKIVMNSEHVEIKEAEPPIKARLEMYGRKGIQTGTVELNNMTLTYKNELNGAMETLSTNVESLVFSYNEGPINTDGVRLLKVALTTSDPGNETAVASCSIITSIACRLTPRILAVRLFRPSTSEEIARFYEIQPAINAAQNGDEVQCMGKVRASGGIFDGVFPENVTINKSITLKGGYDEDFNTQTFDHQNPRLGTPTTIDGLGQRIRSVIKITGGDVTIEGFVITNGESGIHTESPGTTTIRNNAITGNSGDNGSGILLTGGLGTVVVSDNTVRGNISRYFGGGIFVSGHATISGNVIMENSTISGGGVHIASNSTAAISNNTITENGATSGGGIYVSVNVNAAISSNTITGNSAIGSGGGVCISITSPDVIIFNNTITGNDSSSGGGINTRSPGTTISNNTITGNNSSSSGGGIHVGDEGTTAAIYNNTITGNEAIYYGGGVYINGPGATISNNTIAGNTSVEGNGGGIRIDGKGTAATIANNTITGNSATYTSSGYGGGVYTSGSGTTISNNTITGNVSRVKGGGICTIAVSGVTTIFKNIITGNGFSEEYTTQWGGGICTYNAGITTVSNNIITGNRSSSRGGGICAYGADATTISNNTITGNSSPHGGGIGATGLVTDVINIINSICYGNTSSNISCNVMIPTVTYSDAAGEYLNDGNINKIPIYMDVIAGDYHLQDVPGNDGIIDGGNPDLGYDPEDPLNPGQTLYPPARGAVTNDMGAYGGPGAGVIGFVMPDKDLETPNINEKMIGTY